MCINDIYIIGGTLVLEEFKEIKCQKCGNYFKIGRRSDGKGFAYRKYCDNCSKLPDIREFKCLHCGKISFVKRGVKDFYSKKYCDECIKNKLNYPLNIEKSILSEDKTKLKQICQKCGKEFWVKQSIDKNGYKFFLRRKYCYDCSTIDKNKIFYCQKCGKKIISEHPRKYCDDCLKIDKNETKITYCQKCGKEIILHRIFDLDGKPKGFSHQKYCNECNSAKVYNRVCKVCGKTFETKERYKKYCSLECSKIGQKETLKETTMLKYGVEFPCLLPQCKSLNSSLHSKINIDFENKLKSYGIYDFKSEYQIDNYYYDIFLPYCNILVELNPTFTHTTEKIIYKSVDKNYHKNKTECAIKQGFRVINIWDWDDWNKIIQLLKPKQKLYARKLTLKEITKQEANNFLNQYHLQNSCYGNSVNLGLFNKVQLVQVMTFGKPRYNKNYQWELLRLCSHSDYKIVGGSEKLFKYFIRNYNPESIISYCDISKFTGDVYERLGFKLNNKPQPREHWCNYRDKRHITAALLNQKGFDSLFGTNYGKGTNNRELMIQHNWLPVYDCGQANYIWKL